MTSYSIGGVTYELQPDGTFKPAGLSQAAPSAGFLSTADVMTPGSGAFNELRQYFSGSAPQSNFQGYYYSPGQENPLTAIPNLDFGNLWLQQAAQSGGSGGLDMPSNFGASPDLLSYLNQAYAPQLNQNILSAMQTGGANPYSIYGAGVAGQPDVKWAASSPSDIASMFSSIGAQNDPRVQEYLSTLGPTMQSAQGHASAYDASQATRERNAMMATLAVMAGGAALGGLGVGGAAGAGAGELGGAGGYLSGSGFGDLALTGGGQVFNSSAFSGLGGFGGLGDASWGVNPRLDPSMFDAFGGQQWGSAAGAPGFDMAALAPDIYTMYGSGDMSGLLGGGLDWGASAGLGGGGGLWDSISSLFGGGGGGSNSLLSSIGGLFGGGGGGGGGLGGLLSNPSILGALLGGGAAALGSRGDGTVDVKTSPWEPQQPYLLQGYQAAANQLGQTQPSQVTGPAEQQLQKTIQGDYLNPETNPYLAQTYQIAQDQITPGIESYFAKFGRQGSTAAGNVLGTSYANLANQIYGGNYQQERARQHAGILGAPGFSQQNYQAQFTPVNQYMQAVGGRQGMTESTPYTSNLWGEILSGAMGGAGIGNMIGRYF